MAQYYYDAFGNILSETGSISNPFRYVGYQYDAETKLYYLNARMHDPKLARFLQEDTYRCDPNDPLSLNLYTYCHNESIMYTDPTGHSWLSATGNFFGGVGDAVKDTLTGIVNIVAHPVQTAKALGNAVMHPIKIGKAIYSDTLYAE